MCPSAKQPVAPTATAPAMAAASTAAPACSSAAPSSAVVSMVTPSSRRSPPGVPAAAPAIEPAPPSAPAALAVARATAPAPTPTTALPAFRRRSCCGSAMRKRKAAPAAGSEMPTPASAWASAASKRAAARPPVLSKIRRASTRSTVRPSAGVTSKSTLAAVGFSRNARSTGAAKRRPPGRICAAASCDNSETRRMRTSSNLVKRRTATTAWANAARTLGVAATFASKPGSVIAERTRGPRAVSAATLRSGDHTSFEEPAGLTSHRSEASPDLLALAGEALAACAPATPPRRRASSVPLTSTTSTRLPSSVSPQRYKLTTRIQSAFISVPYCTGKLVGTPWPRGVARATSSILTPSYQYAM
mmetsp:Transcript_23995/g.72076  ORF Transcript_23995/g.72076 Transcript_23995/m.72076 type:complete len:361 (-) Transcript_23995:366-1448(-)